MTKRVRINDYDVGYKRPPVANQFQPGKSGNSKGRPKGARNFSTELDIALNERVTVTANGKTMSVRKKAVIAKQLVNKAASGDLKAASLLMAEGRSNDPLPMADPTTLPPSQNEAELMAGILKRFKAYHAAAVTTDAAPAVPQVTKADEAPSDAPSSSDATSADETTTATQPRSRHVINP